jgi:hypothetical protein
MTTATEILAGLPQGRVQSEREARAAAIFKHVERDEFVPIRWVEVPSESGPHTARFFVNAVPLALGDEDNSFFVATTARTAQVIADELDAYLWTPHLCDLVWRAAAKRLTPCTQTSWADGTMELTYRMLEHSDCVAAKIGASCGLVSDAGKVWAITRKVLNQRGLAANYGWHVSSGALPAANRWAGRVIQSVGHRHNDQHVDYSQTVRLVRRDCIVDGREMDVGDVGTHPELAPLLSHEGILKSMRLLDQETRVAVPSDIPDTSPRYPSSNEWRELMERGDQGRDVAAWQVLLLTAGYDLGSWGADGDFGGLTHNATLAWQKAHGLKGDGVVGPKTRASIGGALVARADPAVVAVPFVEATNYGPRNDHSHRRDLSALRWLVLHSMEAVEASTTAERVAAWFASGNRAPRASAHFNIDDDSIVQSVPIAAVAWGAPGANAKGIHFEHAGYARQTAQQWLDGFSSRMLLRSAKLAANVIREHAPQIPLRFVDREGLKRGEPGITTHNEVSRAFHKTDHTDPGKNFPMDQWLAWAKTELSVL